MKCGHWFGPLCATKKLGKEQGKGYGSRWIAVVSAALVSVILIMGSGCGIINPGKPLWIVKTDPDEKYWLVKNVVVTPGSSHMSKKEFDHNINPVVNVVFTPTNEKNRYVAETVWLDPMGQEFRTIRTTHDIQQEGKKSIDRRHISEGTVRMHTMSTKDLYDHKPGLWLVRLYLDGELARKLEFSVR